MVGISLEGKEKATRSVNKLNYNRKSQVVEDGRQHQCVPTETRQEQTSLQRQRAPSTVQRETERTGEASQYEYDGVAQQMVQTTWLIVVEIQEFPQGNMEAGLEYTDRAARNNMFREIVPSCDNSV